MSCRSLSRVPSISISSIRSRSILRFSCQCRSFSNTTPINPHAEDTKRIRVYTKTGDQGTSVLFNLQRFSKSDQHFESLGDCDELNAQLGVCREHCLKAKNGIAERLEEIQSRLFDIGSHIATPLTTSSPNQLAHMKFDDQAVQLLEAWIDEMDSTLPPLRNFVLPSGGLSATSLHVARAVARRAERRAVPLLHAGDIDPVIIRYLNRLSDFLFVSARYAAQYEQQPEVLWIKPKKRAASSSSTSAASSTSTSSSSSSFTSSSSSSSSSSQAIS